MEKYFKNRTTIREYNKKEISDSLLNEIIDAAVHAPTTGNMQLYSIIITKDPQKIKQLSPTHFNQLAATNAIVLVTFCADFHRFEKWCTLRNAKPGYRNFQSFISALLDTTIVAQQFVTIAEIRGLGTCYLGTTTYNAEQISKILNLPEMVVPVATISVGYPEGEVQHMDRLPIEAVIHNEEYKDYTEEDIAKYYKAKEEREDNKGFVEENNKETLAQVFTDIRYNKENNEVFSKLYQEFIEKKGFKFPF